MSSIPLNSLKIPRSCAQNCGTIKKTGTGRLISSEIVTAALHEGVLDKYESIDLSDTNKVMIDSKAGFQINFGQGDNYAEKTGWISKMLDSLAKETVKTGTIDVSSGKFATFRP